ncbi:MAG: DUF2807 domain-containing protein, partial [Bacteroides sp.]|nr:DUF2807 domain-containing protein [Bacteroides sp.]
IVYGFVFSILALVCVLPVSAGTSDREQDRKKERNKSSVSVTRQVAPFTEIELTCVGNILFTQSDTYSLRLEGTEDYVKSVTTEVKGTTLQIECKEKKKFNNGKIQMTVYLSAPSLEAVNIKGVGDFTNEGSLQCDELILRLQGVGNFSVNKLKADKVSLELTGVGNMEVDLECDNLYARMSGVGQMELSGRARVADIRRTGVGSLNRKNLKVTESR